MSIVSCLKFPRKHYEAMKSHGSNQSETSMHWNVFKRQFELPRIELKKFNGSLMSCWSFWSQFWEIVNDDNIDPEKNSIFIAGKSYCTRLYDIVHS